jgi:DNA-binding MarR family transcriptional regulator
VTNPVSSVTQDQVTLNPEKPGALPDGANPVAALLAEVNALAIRLKQTGQANAENPGDLPGAEHAVLEILDRAGAMTVPQIARERSTSRQNIQILVDRLAVQGRIELVSNPAHKRSGLVRLTHKGRAWLAAGEQAQMQTLLEIGEHLSEMEINATASLLRKIHGLLPTVKRADHRQPVIRAKQVIKNNSRDNAPQTIESGIEAVEEDFPINLL